MFAKLTSAKLTSTKLSPNRVSRQSRPGLRPEPMLLVAPAHANDNHVTRHGPGAAAKRPVLACRWGPSATGGLECRWFLAGGEAPGAEEPGPEQPGGAARERPVAVGGRHLTLVVGCVSSAH
jgi:hypothetical protein